MSCRENHFGCLLYESYQSTYYSVFAVVGGAGDKCIEYVVMRIKKSRYRPELAQRVDRGIAPPFRDLGVRRGWVVSTTSRTLYPRERPGTNWTGGWVGPRAGLDVCEKFRLHLDFFCNALYLFPLLHSKKTLTFYVMLGTSCLF
jgi:hypothetical protein